MCNGSVTEIAELNHGVILLKRDEMRLPNPPRLGIMQMDYDTKMYELTDKLDKSEKGRLHACCCSHGRFFITLLVSLRLIYVISNFTAYGC